MTTAVQLITLDVGPFNARIQSYKEADAAISGPLYDGQCPHRHGGRSNHWLAVHLPPSCAYGFAQVSDLGSCSRIV